MKMPSNINSLHPEQQLYYRFSGLHDRARRKILQAHGIPRSEQSGSAVLSMSFGSIVPGIFNAEEMEIKDIDVFEGNETDIEACTVAITLRSDGSPYVPEDLLERAGDSTQLLVVLPRIRGRHSGQGIMRTRPFAMSDNDATDLRVLDPIRQYIGQRKIGELPGLLEVADSEYLVSLSQTLEVDAESSVVL